MKIVRLKEVEIDYNHVIIKILGGGGGKEMYIRHSLHAPKQHMIIRDANNTFVQFRATSIKITILRLGQSVKILTSSFKVSNEQTNTLTSAFLKINFICSLLLVAPKGTLLLLQNNMTCCSFKKKSTKKKKKEEEKKLIILSQIQTHTHTVCTAYTVCGVALKGT